MAKTLGNATDLEEVRQRIARLTPESCRAWGSMSVGEMICHLHDGYEVALGERHLAHASSVLPPKEIKHQALYTSIPWGKNGKAAPEVRQGDGGTPPGSFADDQKRLLDTLERFSSHSTLDQTAHPLFGSMTNDDWLRWGYLHADHHLRQFCV